MKKIVAVAASLILFIVAANSQTEKKEIPPPPPPKRIDEKAKVSPPEIVVDEKVQVKKSPPPPRVAMTKFTPPKIVKVEDVKVKEAPVLTVTGREADTFYKRNPSVANVSRQGSIVTLMMKDGSSEKYDLNKKDEDKRFTEKYGNCPIPPHAPKPTTKG